MHTSLYTACNGLCNGFYKIGNKFLTYVTTSVGYTNDERINLDELSRLREKVKVNICDAEPRLRLEAGVKRLKETFIQGNADVDHRTIYVLSCITLGIVYLTLPDGNTNAEKYLYMAVNTYPECVVELIEDYRCIIYNNTTHDDRSTYPILNQILNGCRIHINNQLKLNNLTGIKRFKYYTKLFDIDSFFKNEQGALDSIKQMVELVSDGSSGAICNPDMFYTFGLFIYKGIDWTKNNSNSNYSHKDIKIKEKSNGNSRKLVLMENCLKLSCEGGHQGASNLLATVYFNMKKYADAKKVLETGLSSGDPKICAFANELMGKMYILEKKYLEAEPYWQNIFSNNWYVDNPEREAETHHSLGMINCVKQNYVLVKFHLKRVIAKSHNKLLTSSAATLLACHYYCELNYNKVGIYLEIMKKSRMPEQQKLAQELAQKLNYSFLNGVNLELDGDIPDDPIATDNLNQQNQFAMAEPTSTLAKPASTMAVSTSKLKASSKVGTPVQNLHVIAPSVMESTDKNENIEQKDTMSSSLGKTVLTKISAKTEPCRSAGRADVPQVVISPENSLKKIIDGEIQELAAIGKIIQVRGRKIFVIMPHDLLAQIELNRNTDLLRITNGSGGEGVKFFKHRYEVNGKDFQCSEIKQLGVDGGIRTLMIAIDDSTWERKLPGKFLLPVFYGEKATTVRVSGELKRLLKNVVWTNKNLENVIEVLEKFALQLNVIPKNHSAHNKRKA